MRTTSLLALAQGFRRVPEPLRAAFEAQLSERDFPLAAVKEHEASSVVRLARALRTAGLDDPAAYEGFVFSFSIPQISSEFDLLKVCDGAVVDVELKVEDVGQERIERQLARNRYYLAPLERKTYTFTYVADEDRLYELDEGGSLVPSSAERLAQVLLSAGRPYDGRVEDLFKASNYLVSPINDTDRFLKGSYFLTNHQAQIKQSLLRAREQAPGQPTVYLVYGSAGTGKSLLLYDLARTLGAKRSACVIHCGVLSVGHELLNQRQDGFRVVSAKGMERQDLAGYDAVLVDEAQLLWPSQLRRLVQTAVERAQTLYVSLGRRSMLSRRGVEYDVEEVVRSLCPEVSVWELSRKIRTNPELASFVRALFRMPGRAHAVGTRSVKVCCADGVAGAQALVRALQDEGYHYVAYTGGVAQSASLDEVDVPGAPSASAVVGQEFDKVVMVVGRRFSDPDAELYRQLLLQGLSCARDRIALVVLDNDELLAELLHIIVGN